MKLTFGERVALARQRAGMATQEDLGTKVGVHRNAVGKWEKDLALPEGKVMVQLPGVLGIDGHWLLTGDGDMELRDPDDDAIKVRVIGKIVDGKVDPVTLRALNRGPHGSPEKFLDALGREIGGSGDGKGSTSGGSP